MEFKYWDDCASPEEMEAMWNDPRVNQEWEGVGETKGRKVHLSRDPDGQLFLTSIEMKAVARIISRRYFNSQIEEEMISAICEMESCRQLLAESYDKKTNEVSIGLMLIKPTMADWLFREVGYHAYDVEGKPQMLLRPFINIYIGAAYITWLKSYNGKQRNEEFVVRAFIGGPKKATHKSTLEYWKRYVSIKEDLRIQSETELRFSAGVESSVISKEGDGWTYWDSKATKEDMEELWQNSEVLKEWERSGETRGRVRFSQDATMRPYLSRVELKLENTITTDVDVGTMKFSHNRAHRVIVAVAGITISRHFGSGGIRPEFLSALAEVISMRFLYGADSKTGIMGIAHPTALWLYNDLGYKAYAVNSVEDLSMPFVSMYFGAAYVYWLSHYEGRQRTHEFIVQAYLRGPENVNVQETGALWLKFQDLLPHYVDSKPQCSCAIM